MPHTVMYNSGRVITNTEYLPKGTGAKYLEVSTVKDGELIAVAWHRTKPRRLVADRILIEFSKRRVK